jgi:hypothetical protein
MPFFLRFIYFWDYNEACQPFQGKVFTVLRWSLSSRMQSVFVNIFSVIFLAIAFILEVPRRPVHTYAYIYRVASASRHRPETSFGSV